jgi:hypothetical protein
MAFRIKELDDIALYKKACADKEAQKCLHKLCGERLTEDTVYPSLEWLLGRIDDISSLRQLNRYKHLHQVFVSDNLWEPYRPLSIKAFSSDELAALAGLIEHHTGRRLGADGNWEG